MREHSVNKLDNFIMGWYMDPEEMELCDRLKLHWHMSTMKGPGRIGYGVESDSKKSLDCALTHSDISEDYVNTYLQKCIDSYTKKYSFSNSYSAWTILRPVSLQYYGPGDGFYGWHCERTGVHHQQRNRHLSFITYLNDVTDGGGTEFFHQKLTIKAEKGLTIFFPCDWTFTHKGETSFTQKKYIATGWYEYIPADGMDENGEMITDAN